MLPGRPSDAGPDLPVLESQDPFDFLCDAEDELRSARRCAKFDEDEECKQHVLDAIRSLLDSIKAVDARELERQRRAREKLR
jgi:hypothetical protein